MPHLESLEARVGSLMRRRKLTLAIAESCTGGLIADRITDIPGSSEYFVGGVVAYAYEAKVSVLGVSWDTLRAYGAVSQQTVCEMARGIRRVLTADVGIAVTGIAGPGGGLPNKPIGTTWIGLATEAREHAREFHFEGDRRSNKSSAAEAGLQLLLDYLDDHLR
jgi:PncC family amidohydrolase